MKTSYDLFKICSLSFCVGNSVTIPTMTKAAEPVKTPNILFCLADDATFLHMGAYGCKWVKTPAFDRIAREGVLFTHAYTCNAKCSPSRSSILTGRNSWQLKKPQTIMAIFQPSLKPIEGSRHKFFSQLFS